MFRGVEDDSALGETHIAWTQIAKASRDPGQLPDPGLEVPDRDPSTVTTNPVAAAYRELFEQLDLDPQRHPPAGERLARRLAKGDPLPREHPILDVVRLASTLTLVPLSVHDLDALEPPLTVRRAGDDETFKPRLLDAGQVPSGFPLACDQEGPIAMLGYEDAKRTAPRDGTDMVLVVAWGSSTTAPRLLPDAFRQVDRYASLVGWRFATSTQTRTVGEA